MSTTTSKLKPRIGKYSNLWHLVNTKFSSFCSHCTLHGAYYFSNGRWWLRSAWILIVCCSLGLCCFLSHMIWEKFVIDPTLTVVETTHYTTASIPFPAVTVCDTEMIHGPNTDNITSLLTLRGYNRSQISEFYESFIEIRNTNYEPTSYVRKMHYLLDDLGFSLKKLLQTFKKPCDEVMLQCFWRSRQHNCTDMFRSVYTVTGYCCQFDIPYFMKHAPTDTNFVAGIETTEALDLIISSLKVSANGNQSSGRVSMYVFDQKDQITLIDSAILLSPGAYFDVNVYLWVIDSSSYVKALSLQARKCIVETDPGVGNSFYQGCLTRLILRKVVLQCRCLPFEYKAQDLDVEELVACTWERLICVYQEIEKVLADMRDIIYHSECYQRCDYIQYENEVEYIKNHRNYRELAEVHSRVSIHYSDNTCIKYRREVLYTWDQMLANLGGIFGLCLGGSIVSVMEIVWFLFDILFSVFQAAFTKKVGPKDLKEQNTNKVFIVTQSIPKEVNNKLFKADHKDDKKLGKNSAEVRYKFIN